MLKKILGVKIELLPKVPQANEMLCETCGGIGWLMDQNSSQIVKCQDCYGGVHHLCPYCHTPSKGICTDKNCLEKRASMAETKRIDKAIKAKIDDVPEKDKGMLYSDSYPYNEGYFAGIEDLVEYCRDEGIIIPSYIWSTDKVELTLDAMQIIENACEELHEDAVSNIKDEEELQLFLNNWCKKQTGTDTYIVNYKYAIEVPNVV